MDETADILDRLFAVIVKRLGASPDQSYVARLAAGGVEAINAKVREEAEEVCQAAAGEGDVRRPAEGEKNAHLTAELCDLLFHAFVLAAARGVSLDDLRVEFGRRFGVSGLVEKAKRRRKAD